MTASGPPAARCATPKAPRAASYTTPRGTCQAAREVAAVEPPQGPAVNPYKHVGRNDPCPCGSGKKFKKCCLPRVSTP